MSEAPAKIISNELNEFHMKCGSTVNINFENSFKYALHEPLFIYSSDLNFSVCKGSPSDSPISSGTQYVHSYFLRFY